MTAVLVAGLLLRRTRCFFPSGGRNHRLPRRDGQAELAWVAGYIPRWYACPKTVTRPNRAQR